MQNSKAIIKTSYGMSDSLEIDKGVRQGDALTATLFILSLEACMKKMNLTKCKV